MEQEHCPLISVIVPVYNVEPYLREAVDSVLGQSYSNWELILVDDGSRDRSGDICDAYAAWDPRTRVFHTPNRGVSHARNVGMAAAKGEWLAFLDSDDRLRPDALRILLAHSPGVDLVICGYETFPNRKAYHPVNGKPIRGTFPDLRSCFFELYRSTAANVVWAKLYRTSALRLIFDTTMTYGEDTAFILRLFSECGGICVIPEALYEYRRDHSVTLSTQFHGDAVYCWQKIWEQARRTFSGAPEVLAFYGGVVATRLCRHCLSIGAQTRLSAAQKQILLQMVQENPLLADPRIRQQAVCESYGDLWDALRFAGPEEVYRLACRR